MPRRKEPQQNRTNRQDRRATRTAKPDEQWTEAEHTSGQTESAAHDLVDRAGSRERAKRAVDTVDEGHPP